jgi:hypothetical protein
MNGLIAWRILYDSELRPQLLSQCSSTTCSVSRSMLACAAISPDTKHSPLVEATHIVHLWENVSATAEDQDSPFSKYGV